MSSTTPRTDDRAESRTDSRTEPGRAPGERRPEAEAPVPMRVLLASCRAAEAVSTPPERRAA